jgi:hypothetical protein
MKFEVTSPALRKKMSMKTEKQRTWTYQFVGAAKDRKCDGVVGATADQIHLSCDIQLGSDAQVARSHRNANTGSA